MSGGKRYHFNPPKLSRESSTAYRIPAQASQVITTGTVSSGTPENTPNRMSKTDEGSRRWYCNLPAINSVSIVVILAVTLALTGLTAWNIILTKQLETLIEAQPNSTCHLDLAKECELTKSEVATLVANLSALAGEQYELKMALQDLSTRHTGDTEELSRQIEDTKSQVRSIADNLSSHGTTIDNLVLTQQNITTVLATVLRDLEITRQSITLVNTSLNNLERTVSGLRQVIQTNTSLLSSVQAALTEAVTTLSQAQSSFNRSLMVLYEEATFNTSQLSGHIQTVNGHIRATNNSLNELSAKVNSFEMRTEDDISQLNNQLVDSFGQLQNQLGVTSGRLISTNERLAQVETGQDTLGDRLDVAEGGIEHLTDEGAVINGRLDSQDGRVGELESDVDELQSSGGSVTSSILVVTVVSIIILRVIC